MTSCASNTNIDLSIVIPLYNEGDCIRPLYASLKGVCERLRKNYEIIFIDDGSSDSTYSLLYKIQSEDSLVKIIKFRKNYGQTAAMAAGFKFSQGKVIVSMDGDLQNDPADIPRLLAKLEQGYDLVCGWRRNRKDKLWTRRVPSVAANWLIGKVTGVPIHDNGCSLKAYRSEIIKSASLYADMHRFIPAITTLSGARITEMVVNHRGRKYGKAKYGLSRIWKVLFDMITIKMLIHFHNRPLLWFSILGLIFFVFGLGFGIASIVQFFHGTLSIVYPTTSFLFLSLFGNLLCWGLLAEFLIKEESRKDTTQWIKA